MPISILGQLMTARQDIEVKAEADASSETLMVYEKEASVFVTGQEKDGWYRVMYQGITGYVPAGSMAVQNMDIVALDEEMAENAKETVFITETVEKYRRESLYDTVWLVMIAALVAGIIIAGILKNRNS
ncbi:MAG: SH3 domain-containing protein [Bacillus sp. (in: Bacteria)]|nr:SH3 domain-containing protein [Bacillus sp. (in: firmicutes)]MCM1427604.1 SH3 domain-containing protein [Eubacterium sp.]